MEKLQEISAKRKEELKISGYSVVRVFDGDPELFAWMHAESGASQGFLKAR